MTYWGDQTALAIRNFDASGEVFPLEVIYQLALIKVEAARINHAMGVIDLDDLALAAIVDAGERIARGELDGEFPIDVFQTGSGTSSNMNVNEVIANLASQKVNRTIHPNDHVNASQSSNDAVPSAVHMAVANAAVGELLPALRDLRLGLEEVAAKFSATVKIGRTHLMDAVPVTLGQEFGGMARAMELGHARVTRALEGLMELPLGGTATGTGLNAPEGFASGVISALAARTGLPWREAVNHFEAQGARDALVEMSSMCRSVAISLFKMANDIRWMASGPVGGLGEINLPSLQAGSSIMPGKVNPVIAEVVCQVAAQVIGNDSTIAFAGSSGSFELNVMVPVIARNLLQSVHLLARSARALDERCVRGLTVNEDAMRATVERSPMVATGLNRLVGYDHAKELVEASERTGVSVAELAVETGLVDATAAKLALDIDRLARPHQIR